MSNFLKHPVFGSEAEFHKKSRTNHIFHKYN